MYLSALSLTEQKIAASVIIFGGWLFIFAFAYVVFIRKSKSKYDPIVSFKVTPKEDGYWLISRSGRVFPFGAAHSTRLADALVTSPVATYPYFDGRGFLASPFNKYLSSRLPGLPLNAPIIFVQVTASCQGVWMVGADGGVFCEGNAVFYGSTGFAPDDLSISWKPPTQRQLTQIKMVYVPKGSRVDLRTDAAPKTQQSLEPVLTA